ncbi:4662_t:CDS:2, partial [Gigaspora rosea]
MLDQKKSSGKYRRTKKPRRVQKNNDVPLTTSYLISLLWGALNPLYNGIASLESLSNYPVVEVDDAHVELKSLEYDSETDVTEEEFSKHKSLKHADDKANSPNDSNDECQNNPCDQKNNQENDCQNNVPQNKDPQNKDFQRAKDAKNRMQEQ